jgi:hypothetical protein
MKNAMFAEFAGNADHVSNEALPQTVEHALEVGERDPV